MSSDDPASNKQLPVTESSSYDAAHEGELPSEVVYASNSTNQDQPAPQERGRALSTIAFGLALGALLLTFTYVRELAFLLVLATVAVAAVALFGRAREWGTAVGALIIAIVSAILAVVFLSVFGFEGQQPRDLNLFLGGLILVGLGVLGLSVGRRLHLSRMAPSERAFHDAEAEYFSRIKSSKRHLFDAESKYRAGVQVATDARQQAELVGRRYIGAYGTLKVWEHVVATDRGTYPMTTDVRATVDTAGHLAVTSRSTLTRVAAGGILAGPLGLLVGAAVKKSTPLDLRELYLVVESERFATIVQCEPNDGNLVRQLSVAINHAARQAHLAELAHQDAVERASAALDIAREDTAALEEARQLYSFDVRNTTDFDAARALTRAARKDTPGPSVGSRISSGNSEP